MAALASRQYGVVTREQLNNLGYSEAAIGRAVASGRLHALHRRVFAVGHQGLSPHGLCMAAVLFRGSGALISFQSAAWLWGLERKLEIPVHVSVRWRGHAQDAIGLHHCPALRSEDIAETERLPVTGVARTLLDHASEVKGMRLERAIDRADRLGLLDLAAVDRITEEVRGHRGRRPLLRALVVYREKGFTRSGGEKRMLAVLADAGVRLPAVNCFVEGYELDFYWERERLAVELDSWEFHRDRRSFEEDRKRQEDLAMAGIEVIRITGTRLKREPRKVAMRIAALLDRRRQAHAA
ncbi:MAG: type IV toxin-antitoxin system AbiEi family antitoxin domain-containing protein [Solirubrobacterales bacterium]